MKRNFSVSGVSHSHHVKCIKIFYKFGNKVNMETEDYKIWAKICGKTERLNMMSLAQMGHTFWVWCIESAALILIKSQTCALNFIHRGYYNLWLIHLKSPINLHTLLLTTIFWVLFFCASFIKQEGTTRKTQNVIQLHLTFL